MQIQSVFDSLLSVWKALDLAFINPFAQVLNKMIYLDPKWDAATGIAS